MIVEICGLLFVFILLQVFQCLVIQKLDLLVVFYGNLLHWLNYLLDWYLLIFVLQIIRGFDVGNSHVLFV